MNSNQLSGSIEKAINDDSVREIHILAARLRAEFGELDDEAIQAVSETTGFPAEYVRLAVRSAPVEQRQTFVDRVKSAFIAFDPDLRRYTMSAVLAAFCGLSMALSASTRDSSGFLGTLALISLLGALWNAAISKSLKVAVFSGVAFGAINFMVMTLFTFLFRLLPNFGAIGPAPAMIIFWMVGGAASAAFVHQFFVLNREKLGLKDPSKERYELLRQLHDIQDKLKSDEKFVTFLSVDIVGSTRMKTEADPLMLEFTFTEYHKYIGTVAEKFGGKVHSTAGDGVTCVFESPAMGYSAGRAILAGLFEFNSFRNRLTKPIEIRAGVHTGSALIAGQDLANVNFAHVIDVAAHMQKAGDPGSLVVSKSTGENVPGGFDIIEGNRVTVEDIEAVVWKPRTSVIPQVPTARQELV